MRKRFESVILLLLPAILLLLSACAADVAEAAPSGTPAEQPSVSETWEPPDTSILSELPPYTYEGTLAGTYDMSASGMYYAKGSRTDFDPALKGKPVVDTSSDFLWNISVRTSIPAGQASPGTDRSPTPPPHGEPPGR